MRNACICDHHVEPAGLLDRLRHEAFDLVEVGNIGRDAPALAPYGLDLLNNLVNERLRGMNVVDDNVEAVPREAEGDRLADSPSAAGYLSALSARSGH